MTRKSTTGMVAIYGTHVLKHSSNIQSHHSPFPQARAKYYALVKGGSVGLGLQSLCADLGLDLEVTIEGDSNAAKGTVNRVGLGKARHIQNSLPMVCKKGVCRRPLEKCTTFQVSRAKPMC